MDTKQILQKHTKRLLTEAVIRSLLGGLSVGFGVNFIFAFLYWMFGLGSILLGLGSGVLLGVACGVLLYFFRYRVSEKEVARRIDRLGLHERAVSMLELRDSHSCIAELQREDAAAGIARLSPKSLRYRISSAFALLTSAVLLVSLTFTVLGALAQGGSIPYGKDLLSQGADGGFSVVYQVGEGGRLVGEANQTVSLGNATSPVRAVAEDGYMFVGWDDGERSPERRESDVRADVTFYAMFQRIGTTDAKDDDTDAADDLPVGGVSEEGGGGDSDETGGEDPKDGDGEGQGGGKWQDRNQFIDGATYYRDYLEFYYQYATGIFESDSEIPPEIIEFFELYFSGI